MNNAFTTISALAEDMGIKIEQFGAGQTLLMLHGRGG